MVADVRKHTNSLQKYSWDETTTNVKPGMPAGIFMEAGMTAHKKRKYKTLPLIVIYVNVVIVYFNNSAIFLPMSAGESTT